MTHFSGTCHDVEQREGRASGTSVNRVVQRCNILRFVNPEDYITFQTLKLDIRGVSVPWVGQSYGYS